MDDNEWDDDERPFVGSHQQYNNGTQQPQYGSHQPQYVGQQHYRPGGQQVQGAQPSLFGLQQQQQQYAGLHVQTGSQQQPYSAQNAPTRVQQAQGRQVGVGGPSSQGDRAISGGQPQLNMSARRSSTNNIGRQLSSASGSNNRNSSDGSGQAAGWLSNQRNVSAPLTSQSSSFGLATTQQPARNLATQPFLQTPIATQGPSGQVSSNGYTAGHFSGNPFNQQILPRHRPQGGHPQSVSGHQRYIGNSQQFQQNPMAMRNPPRQSSSNSSNQQTLPRHRLQGGQSHSAGEQQQNLADSQQLLPSTSQPNQQQYQSRPFHLLPGQPQFLGNNQQYSPNAAQFQPGIQQHVISGSLNVSNQQAEGTRQTSTASYQYSSPALDIQPGVQQHFANQPNLPRPHYQRRQESSGAQRGRNDQRSHPSRQQFQHSSQGYSPQALGEVTAQKYEAMDEGDEQCEDGFRQEGRGENYSHERSSDRPGQWLGQSSTDEGQNGRAQIPEGMMEDPLYQQMLLQVQQWEQEYNLPMTEDQRARLVASEILRDDASLKGRKRPAELDEDDVDEDLIEEAVRDAKRRRIQHEALNFHTNAHKIFIQGPVNRPDSMDIDKHTADDNQVTGLDLDFEILGVTDVFKGKFSGQTLSLADNPFKKPYEHQVFDRNFRLIESICCDWAFMIEVTKHLRVKDIVMLYSVSKTFHNLVNLRFQSTIAAWAQEISPSGWKVFYWKVYGKLSMKDPADKPWAMPGPVEMPGPPWAAPQRNVSRSYSVRSVPSLKYLAMIAQRETRTRDIVACLARAGHRLPETMHVTLKKIWMLMDMPTNILRRAFIRNESLWTPRDLYNAQMFYVKLQMRFNEPIFGPKSTVLADTFLGLRDGLNPLWRLLRRKDYLKGEEILQQRLKYYCRESTVIHYLLVRHTYAGVDPADLGNEHREGWGSGRVHLSRPDELVVEESVRRNLRMDKHTVFMMFWGHVDWKRRLNLVPTEEEMYMYDEELPSLPKTGKYAAHGMWGRCGNVPFEFDNWQPKHSMKARWNTLTREEKLAIIKDDHEEQMKALPFEKEVSEKFWELPYNSNDRPHPDYPSGEPPEPEESGREDADGDTYMGEADSDRSEGEHEKGAAIVQYEYIYEDESLPLPDSIEDEDIIVNWYDLDPYLQQKIIEEHEKLYRQDVKDERTLAIIVNDEMSKLAKAEKEEKEKESSQEPQNGGASAFAGPSAAAGPSNQSSGHPTPYTSPMKKQPKRYRYPGITDPTSLALLERYDRFAPEEFRTDEDGRILRGEQQSSSGFSSSSSSRSRGSDQISDYDEYDDDDLKALADKEYDSDQVDFDLDSYEKFLDRIGDRGGFVDPDAEDDSKSKDKCKGKAKTKAESRSKKDIKGKGKAIAVESSGDDDDGDEMAHEGDLDDDLPLPKYDFRKF